MAIPADMGAGLGLLVTRELEAHPVVITDSMLWACVEPPGPQIGAERSGTLHTQTARFQSHAGDESGRSARDRLLETMRSFGTARLVLALTGQESQAAVVLAALIVAALFQPLRARVQTLLDRRFYWRKYDVARTLD